MYFQSRPKWGTNQQCHPKSHTASVAKTDLSSYLSLQCFYSIFIDSLTALPFEKAADRSSVNDTVHKLYYNRIIPFNMGLCCGKVHLFCRYRASNSRWIAFSLHTDTEVPTQPGAHTYTHTFMNQMWGQACSHHSFNWKWLRDRDGEGDGREAEKDKWEDRI